MNNQGNMTTPKETNKMSVTDHKEMKTYKVQRIQNNPLMKFNEPQADTNMQLNKIRKSINEQNEKLTKTGKP